MNKDPKVFLAHIMESIGLIEEYSEGKIYQDFMRSKSLQDMIIRRIEIIGEAVKYLPDDIKDSHSEVPWKKMAGMRDILIHQYFGVDIEAHGTLLKRIYLNGRRRSWRCKKSFMEVSKDRADNPYYHDACHTR